MLLCNEVALRNIFCELERDYGANTLLLALLLRIVLLA